MSGSEDNSLPLLVSGVSSLVKLGKEPMHEVAVLLQVQKLSLIDHDVPKGLATRIVATVNRAHSICSESFAQRRLH